MSRARPIIVGLLLSVMLVTEIAGAISDSQTVDEGTHLASGYSYWKTAKTTLNKEHPPLIKLLASAPLLFLNITGPFHGAAWAEKNQWDFARQFLYHNTIDGKKLLVYGRIPMILLTVLIGLIVYIWTRHLFGERAGLFSLAFFILDPTVLAHGRLITTDAPLALFFTLTIWLWYRYLAKPRWLTFILFGLAFSAAQLTKFSAIILWVIVPILGLIALYRKRSKLGSSANALWKKFFKITAVLLVLVSALTWSMYFFEFRPAASIPTIKDLYKADSLKQKGTDITGSALSNPVGYRIFRSDLEPGRTIKKLLTDASWPAVSYFHGLDNVLLHNNTGHQGTMPAYLLGKDSIMGWWYYFPVAFIVKTPLSILILLSLALALATKSLIQHARSTGRTLPWLRKISELSRTIPFSAYALVVPPIVYFLFSLTSHINLGIRHLLPVLPFIYIGLGYLFSHRTFNNRAGTIILTGFFVTTATIAGFVHPNQLSYFSELVGGSRFGPKYLLDSNLDWGQGFYGLQTYLDEKKPDPFYGAFFTSIDLSALNITPRPMPEDEQVEREGIKPGTYAISAMLLYEPIMPYHWLRRLTPTRILRGSIYIFNIQ